METTITSSAPAAKPRRRWWLRGLLLLLVLVIVVPVGVYQYSAYAIRVAWEEADADADRTDPEWRMTQILLARRVVPDKDNSALQIIAVAAKTTKISVENAPSYEEIFAKLPPNVQFNAQQAQLIQGTLGKIAGPLEEARQLRKFTYGRFPIKIDPIFIATALPDHQKPRDLSRLLKHDAYLLAHEKRYDDALDSCRACLCTARSMGDEPLIISHLIRMAIQTESITALERVLAQGSADEAALAKMQTLVELELKESTWLPTLRGERAGSQSLFDGLHSGKMPLKVLRGFAGNAGAAGKGSSVSELLVEQFPSLVLKYYPEHLMNMTRIVEIAKLPLHEQRAKIEAWDQATKASGNPIIGMLAPAVSKVYHAECRSHAHLRAAAAALACERYRLAHGNWPESLDVLVEKKLLSAVPTDPIDGKPLRYRKDKEMIVIYSIGADEKDDGGKIDRDVINALGVDIGFRFWHEPNRRQTPRPPVVVKNPDAP